jgi:hypothetical protein
MKKLFVFASIVLCLLVSASLGVADTCDTRGKCPSGQRCVKGECVYRDQNKQAPIIIYEDSNRGTIENNSSAPKAFWDSGSKRWVHCSNGYCY